MRIGIYGGSFNPPHNMHKTIALELIEKNYLDHIIYVPTGNKYNKSSLIDAKYRLDMLRLMTQGNSNLSVSDYEVKSFITYTYQTLDYFKSIYPDDEIYFICGSDNLKELKTWKKYQHILDNFKLLVIRRNGDDLEAILSDLNNKNIVISNILTSDISSTYIRNCIIDENIEKINGKVDSLVLEYILTNKLYYLH